MMSVVRPILRLAGEDDDQPIRDIAASLYEALGYGPFPVVRYCKVLHESAPATSEVAP